MKKKTLLRSLILLAILFFVFFLNNSFNYLDPDLGWHLKAGQSIVQDQKVSTINHYNYTLNNIEWVNHEWLLDTFSYFIYNNFNYIVLSSVFVFLTILVFYFLYKFLKLRYKGIKDKKRLSFNFSFFIYTVISLFGIIAISPHVGLRMQVLALLFFVLLLIVLEKYNQKRKLIYFILIPLLFLVWANMHGTFILGLGLLFAFLGIKILERILYYFKVKKVNYSYLWTNKKIVAFLSLSLLSVLITLVNPYGFKLYDFLSGYTNTFYLSHIQEWLPQYTGSINIWQITYLGLALSLILVVWFLNKYKNIKFNLWDIFLFIFFLYFAISSKRHFPLFFIATAPVIIYLLNQIFVENKDVFTTSYLKKYISIKYIKYFIFFMYILVISSLLSQIKFTNTPFSSYCYKYPCAAVNFIQNNEELKTKKIFNKYSWGGYLIWSFPKTQIFIDGRMPQLEYKKHTFLEEYFEFFEEGKVEKKLNEYNIELVLIENNKNEEDNSWFEKKVLKLNHKEKNNYLHDYLESNKSWKKAFSNGVSIIYIR
ncbi:MAG TPA: hypothetical protein VJ926_01235 [Patescibacteria group bacterium]|nr:hypothetical protein [Patescibacteria group bacterium]